MGEQLDPEAYRGVMGRYFDGGPAGGRAARRHGREVRRRRGARGLRRAGGPRGRRAAGRARGRTSSTRAIQALSEELVASLGVRLEVRTGVNTGSVVTGAARAGGSFATGDAVNTAARLEQAAPPGQVLIGAETYDLVRDAVEVRAGRADRGQGQVRAGGRLPAPRRVRRAHRPRPAHGLRLVGRDRETRALDDALERTLESGRGHLVTVLGAAGIGKSRLVGDFLDRVGDRADVRQRPLRLLRARHHLLAGRPAAPPGARPGRRRVRRDHPARPRAAAGAVAATGTP